MVGQLVDVDEAPAQKVFSESLSTTLEAGKSFGHREIRSRRPPRLMEDMNSCVGASVKYVYIISWVK